MNVSLFALKFPPAAQLIESVNRFWNPLQKTTDLLMICLRNRESERACDEYGVGAGRWRTTSLACGLGAASAWPQRGRVRTRLKGGERVTPIVRNWWHYHRLRDLSRNLLWLSDSQKFSSQRNSHHQLTAVHHCSYDHGMQQWPKGGRRLRTLSFYCRVQTHHCVFELWLGLFY